MKNKLLFFLTILFVSSKLAAENFSIEAKNITLNKNTQISIFEREVIVKTQEDYIIKSDYAEYNKVDGIIIFKNNIYASDDKNNILETNYAKYNEKNKILETVGPTKVSTSEKYVIEGDDFLVDNEKRFIRSEKKSILTDKDNNRIFLDNFEYISKNNIFKSIGFIKIEDVNNNVYEFSQIYIDTKKKEMLGSDAKSFLNDESFKINEKNKPRIFANTVKINDKQSSFEKSIFTTCDYRENDKCPPWTIQSRKMLHDSEKKTIYYDHAIFKFYDIPIFYTPKLFHPDPTVDRRSGFLPPVLSSSKNLGSGVTIPYFLALDDDKNLTLTSKIFNKEHPLIIGEYQQAFKHSTLYTDFGYTEGYKNTSSVKKAGNKSHFLSKFIKEYSFDNTSRKIDIQVQKVSDDKYLKLYKIDSNLIDFETSTLENSIEFTNANQNSFLSLNASIFETLDETYNDKYEYVLPEIN